MDAQLLARHVLSKQRLTTLIPTPVRAVLMKSILKRGLLSSYFGFSQCDVCQVGIMKPAVLFFSSESYLIFCSAQIPILYSNERVKL